MTYNYVAEQGYNLPMPARLTFQQHDTLNQCCRSYPSADGHYRRAIIAQDMGLRVSAWFKL